MKVSFSFLLFIVLASAALSANAQSNIVSAEYFFDTDPGFGSGTAIAVTPSPNVSLSFSPDISILTDGFHNLYVRGKDANGAWSPVTVKGFAKFTIPTAPPAPNITQAEYFIDNDPGFGAGTSLTIASSNNINIAVPTLNITSLSDGFHNLYVRAKDANGAWSGVEAKGFYKFTLVALGAPANIVQAEYFLDTDPGYGAATQLVVTASNNQAIAIPTLNTSSLSNGFHNLYVRGKDANGNWSDPQVKTFYKFSLTGGPPSVNVVQSEYFFDTDPGFGAGSAIPVTAGSNVTLTFSPSISGLPDGFHSIYVRGKDANGNWSIPEARVFYKMTLTSSLPPNIVQAEYFFDLDPGLGNGTAFTFTPAANVTILPLPLDISTLTPGSHVMYVRGKDANGKWSSATANVFTRTASGPTITSFAASSGPIGTTVVITGTNFDPIPANNTVKFNGVITTVSASTATSITTIVPAGATTGTISVTVAALSATSATTFTVTPHVPFGNVVQMNGSVDYIEVPDNAAIRPANMTLEAWINFSSIPTFGPIFNKAVGAGINDTYQLFYLNGVLKATVESFAGLNTFAQYTWTPVVGQWYHVAFTYDDATRSETLYLDGVVVSTNVVGASPQYDNSPLYVGGDRDNGTTYYSFPGTMDEARIWSVARTAGEILGTINSTLAGSEAGLVAYYKMDETGQGAGITVANSAAVSGAAINGTTFGTSCTPIFTLLPPPVVTSFSPSSGVEGSVVNLTGTNFADVTGVSFGGIPATSFTVVSPTSITATVPVGALTGIVTVTGVCASGSSSSNFTVIPASTITITLQPAGATVCDGAVSSFSVAASGTTNISWRWQEFNGTFYADIANGGGYSGVTTSTLSITTAGNFGGGDYRCKVSGDLAPDVFTNSATLTINPLPAPPGSPVNASSCGPGPITISVSGGVNGQYVWYTLPSGGTAIAGEVNASYTTQTLSSSATYYAAINNGTCESTRTAVTATIVNVPPPVTTSASGCPGDIVTLQASGGVNGQYSWYTVSTGGVPIAGAVNNTFVTPPLAGNTDYYVTISNGGCESPRTLVTASIAATGCSPVITPETLTTVVEGKIVLDLVPLITTVGILDLNSMKVVQQPSSGATAIIVSGVLTIDYAGIAFSGTESLTIEVCNTNGLCSEQEFMLEVAGDIKVYNAVSPNGDGKNDFFFLQYIDILSTTKQNQVTIYNRWGDEVFSVNDYDNKDRLFAGLSNGGSKLPSGTYYYKITFGNGVPSRTGFLELKY